MIQQEQFRMRFLWVFFKEQRLLFLFKKTQKFGLKKQVGCSFFRKTGFSQP